MKTPRELADDILLAGNCFINNGMKKLRGSIYHWLKEEIANEIQNERDKAAKLVEVLEYYGSVGYDGDGGELAREALKEMT